MSTQRVDYLGEGITEEELLGTPLAMVSAWIEQATARRDIVEPTALALATVDADHRPNVRTVLMRFLDERGPGFVSSTTSTKAEELAAFPGMAASLTWVPMFRAIRFRGVGEPIAADELLTYWRSRPWGSRISAWASAQSQPVSSRAELEAAYASYAQRWPDHGGPDDVPVPQDWAGWRIACDSVELWAGRRDRLHDRLRYVRVCDGTLADAGSWRIERLQP
ncbi:MAG: pyridoxamine 5'-phosphate oxidase [Nostocoides sp.]